MLAVRPWPSSCCLCRLLATMRLLCLLLTLAAWARGQLVGTTDGVDPATGERPARKSIDDLSAEAGPEW